MSKEGMARGQLRRRVSNTRTVLVDHDLVLDTTGLPSKKSGE